MEPKTQEVVRNREAWLNAFMEAARPKFEAIGHPIPERVRVSVGFTSHGVKGRRIGECWHNTHSADDTFEIFINPSLDDSSRVADVLTHELLHAAVGFEAGHGPEFRGPAIKLGLTGKMTATVAGGGWHEWADPIVESLGPIPHAALTRDMIHRGKVKAGPDTPKKRDPSKRRDKSYVIVGGEGKPIAVANSATKASVLLAQLLGLPESSEKLDAVVPSLRDDVEVEVLGLRVVPLLLNALPE